MTVKHQHVVPSCSINTDCIKATLTFRKNIALRIISLTVNVDMLANYLKMMCKTLSTQTVHVSIFSPSKNIPGQEGD